MSNNKEPVRRYKYEDDSDGIIILYTEDDQTSAEDGQLFVLAADYDESEGGHGDTLNKVDRLEAENRRLRDGFINLIAEFVPTKHKLAAAARLAQLENTHE